MRRTSWGFVLGRLWIVLAVVPAALALSLATSGSHWWWLWLAGGGCWLAFVGRRFHVWYSRRAAAERQRELPHL